MDAAVTNPPLLLRPSDEAAVASVIKLRHSLSMGLADASASALNRHHPMRTERQSSLSPEILLRRHRFVQQGSSTSSGDSPTIVVVGPDGTPLHRHYHPFRFSHDRCQPTYEEDSLSVQSGT